VPTDLRQVLAERDGEVGDADPHQHAHVHAGDGTINERLHHAGETKVQYQVDEHQRRQDGQTRALRREVDCKKAVVSYRRRLHRFSFSTTAHHERQTYQWRVAYVCSRSSG